MVCAGATPLPDLFGEEEKEIQKKQAEVDRLKQELDRAQSELEKVRKENERLKKTRPALVRPTAPEKPTVTVLPALSSLPPLAEGEVLESATLASYFQQDPAGAESRFLKKKLRVKGLISRFHVNPIGRSYVIALVTPDQTPEVSCRFDHQEGWKAVYTKREGRVLVAKLGEKNELLLGELGSPLIVEGVCAGVKEDSLVLKNCRAAGK
jgi:hypothetical protein